MAIHLIKKTGSGPIYRYSTRGIIKQYIVNIKNESLLATGQELFRVPASGANGAEPGGTAR
jgi:hypothetical protein